MKGASRIAFSANAHHAVDQYNSEFLRSVSDGILTTPHEDHTRKNGPVGGHDFDRHT